MTVFIVFNVKNIMVESVWATRELANAAVLYHEIMTKVDRMYLPICERELNTAQIKKELS